MTELVIGIGKGKPSSGKSKDSPMGGDASDDPPESGELDGFDAALDDAFDALERKDRGAFKEALGAAVSAKCAEMYGEHDEKE